MRGDGRPGRARQGFTLIELLVVIGLLGALATLVLSSLRMTRTEALDDGLVRKELADIQRAFRRFEADCVPTQEDYALIRRYGLAVLARHDGYLDTGEAWSFDGSWSSAKAKGWRGPYLEPEGVVEIDADNPAQPVQAGGTEVPVIATPYVNDDDGQAGDYYRVVGEPASGAGTITALWVVFPSHDGALPASPGNPDSYEERFRRLLTGGDT